MTQINLKQRFNAAEYHFSRHKVSVWPAKNCNETP